MPQSAAGFQQQAEGINIDTHPQIKIRFGLTADHDARWKIDVVLTSTICLTPSPDRKYFRSAPAPADRRYAKHHIEQEDLLDFLFNALGIFQRAALQ